MAVYPGTLVEQVVAANNFGVGVGEKRIGIAGFVAKILGLSRRIDTYAYRLNAKLLEVLQSILDTP